MSNDLIAYLRALAEKHPRTVRSAARMRQPLDGADAQALEGALTMTEIERNEARKESDRLYTECEQLWDEYKKMCEVIRTIGARCVELDDSEAVSAILDAILDITENILKKDKQ